MPVYAHDGLAALVGVNCAGVVLWSGRSDSWVVPAVFPLKLFVMALITAGTGFSRLPELGHFPWLPLMTYLLYRLPDLPAGAYANWIWILLAVNGISLVIDTVDVVRWFLGDRAELVRGL